MSIKGFKLIDGTTEKYDYEALENKPDLSGGVEDVQINGASVVNEDGVAEIPIAGNSKLGTVIVRPNSGLYINPNNGVLQTSGASSEQIKSGADSFRPIVPALVKYAAFYGLAQAAGDTTQKTSSNAVGNYTETAKSKINEMLNGAVSVSGTTPTINALPGVRYVCGEVSTLDVVAPESGCIDVLFTSGSTLTVLTVTSAKTGVTAIKWANGFDPSSLDANTAYEINILDGEYGVVASWPV